jgi:transposase-like protein
MKNNARRARRHYSEAEKLALLAKADAPGMTLRAVARSHDLTESALYNWRSRLRQKASIASEPLRFIPYGTVDPATDAPDQCVSDTDLSQADGLPAFGAALALIDRRLSAPGRPSASGADDALSEDLAVSYPGPRPGAIDVTLCSGVRMTVDSYVNEKALARVLRALKEAA